MRKTSQLLAFIAFTCACVAQVKHTTQAPVNPQSILVGPKIINPEKNTPWPYKQSVYSSKQDKDGDIWFGTTNGIYRYDGKVFTNYKSIDGLSASGITEIIEDRGGDIWFGAVGGVIRYSPTLTHKQGEPTFTVFKLPVPSNKVDFVETLYSSADSKQTTQPINHLLEDSKGTIWFSVGYHLYYMDKRADAVVCTNVGGFLKGEKMQMSKGYPDDFGITGICEDTHGSLLISVVSCACCYNVTYSIEIGRLTHPCIQNNCHHDLSNTKDLAAHNSEIASSFKKITLENTNTNMAFGTVLKDRHGNMWFGGVEKGGVYKLEDKHFVRCFKNEELNNSIIATIFEDSKSNIWLGTYADSNFKGSGVFKYNPNTSGAASIAHFTKKDGLCSKHTFSNDVITSIIEDNSGKIWFGGDAGICSYTPAVNASGTGIFTNFRSEYGMKDEHVYFILKAKSGEIWFGTWNLGIYKFDGKKLVSLNE